MLPYGTTCPFLHFTWSYRYPYYPWVDRGTVQVGILPKDIILDDAVGSTGIETRNMELQFQQSNHWATKTTLDNPFGGKPKWDKIIATESDDIDI